MCEGHISGLYFQSVVIPDRCTASLPRVCPLLPLPKRLQAGKNRSADVLDAGVARQWANTDKGRAGPIGVTAESRVLPGRTANKGAMAGG